MKEQISGLEFSPISDDPAEIWLDKVEHGVRVMADEEGVKAAAYTAELLCGAGMPPEERINVFITTALRKPYPHDSFPCNAGAGHYASGYRSRRIFLY